jgi:hypothetical protein
MKRMPHDNNDPFVITSMQRPLMQPPRVEIVMESLKYNMSDKTATCRMKWLRHGSLYLWWNSEAGTYKVMTDGPCPASAETELLHEKSRGTAFELNVRV